MIEKMMSILTPDADSRERSETALINNVNGSLRDLPIEVVETLYPIPPTHSTSSPKRA